MKTEPEFKMGTDTFNAQSAFSKDIRPANSSFQNYEMMAMIDKIKHSKAWEKGELKSMVLLRSPGKEIVLTAIHEGSEIVSFQSDNSAYLEVIEGRLNFRGDSETGTIEEDQVLKINGRIKLDLISMAETVFLLTILKEPSLNQKSDPIN